MGESGFWTHIGFFLVLGFVVSLVVSAYRHEEPHLVLRGTWRRLLKFTAFALVLGLGVVLFEAIFLGKAHAGVSAAGISVHVGSRSFPLEKAPEDFPTEYRTLIAGYQEYAQAHGIAAVCAPPFPVVIFTAGAPGEAAKILKDSEAMFASLSKKLGKRKAPDLLPIFILKKTPQYAPLLQLLVAKHSYLASWAEQAKSLSGFFLQLPPIAVILEDGVKQEEFQLKNQVLHQLVHLEMGLQFGSQPFWLAEGIAWTFEEEMTNSLYSFCYRDGFVFASEHEGWPADVRKLVQKKQFPSFEKIAQGGKSGFDHVRSLGSYGLAKFLLAEQPAAVQAMLESYAKEHKEQFSKNPTQELPVARQKELLVEKAGGGFEAAAQKFLLSGKKK